MKVIYKVKIMMSINLDIEEGIEVSFVKNSDGLYVASVYNTEIGLAKELFPETEKKLNNEFKGIIESCQGTEAIAVLKDNCFNL